MAGEKCAVQPGAGTDCLRPAQEHAESAAVWGGNPPEDQSRSFAPPGDLNLKTTRAWAFNKAFRWFWKCTTLKRAERHFERWHGWAIRSRLTPVKIRRFRPRFRSLSHPMQIPSTFLKRLKMRAVQKLSALHCGPKRRKVFPGPRPTGASKCFAGCVCLLFRGQYAEFLRW